MDQEKEVLIADNRNLAEENVNKEPEIIERKGRISELAEEGKTLCTSVQEKLSEISKCKQIRIVAKIEILLNSEYFVDFQNQRKVIIHQTQHWHYYKQRQLNPKKNPKKSQTNFGKKKSK